VILIFVSELLFFRKKQRKWTVFLNVGISSKEFSS
jgi:hypothetical protein